jgi:squalene-hopene/tetraprenyl-beta-curcumene cyclase
MSAQSSPARQTSHAPAKAPFHSVSPLDRAIGAAQDHLLGRQSADGHWHAELIADATVGSDVGGDIVMLRRFLGCADPRKERAIAAFSFTQQNPDGGWPIYHAGPSDINVTMRVYFALRLMGYTDADPRVGAARARVLALGGIEACRSYTKFYLALFGQYDWDDLPALLPEIVLLPTLRWGALLNRISSWTRAMIVPLLIIYARRPRVEIPFSIRDLRVAFTPPAPAGLRTRILHACFRLADRVAMLYNRVHNRALRARALAWTRQWMITRLMAPGGPGAISPAMVNSAIALAALGYAQNSPEMVKVLRDLEALEVPDGEMMRVAPCVSPVWDTAWAVYGLARSGCDDAEAVRRGANWLLAKQIFTTGDWQVNCPGVEPAAWAFEYDNPLYPDTDDTAAVLMALTFAGRRDAPGVVKAVAWLAAMQNRDGGWGAFDKGIDHEILESLPWADHNALLDPSTADLTGRIIEALGYLGRNKSDPVVARAISFLRLRQETDGSWFGRWGVNYVYGTWQVLVGLRVAGQDMREPWVRKGADWLRGVQNADGGWGESCRSYDDPRFKGIGPSTPSQTAWGLMGLLAAGAAPRDPAVARAVEHLVGTQRADGGWNEDEHTGTGFPRVIYLIYTLYRDYFPLLALQMVREAGDGDGDDGETHSPSPPRAPCFRERAERR